MSQPGATRENQNRLAGEISAYLQQHKGNPVDWYPWGEEALERARSEDRPLLVSIGYSACHWCHVMEHESFSDEETAALMNERFVCIKVDREERPDVDQIFMDAVVAMTGHGGWPLTAFCTPDGRPFYCGTYFPKERGPAGPSFREVLTAISDAFQERRPEIEQDASRVVEALSQRASGVAEQLPGAHTLLDAASRLMQNADREHGGFGGGPKFPTPTNLELLLCALDFVEPESAHVLLEHSALTCAQMARGGLYDHLAGGFHRYCVDGHWGIPHFEKMLYDNGLLLRVYAEMHRRTELAGGETSELEWPVRETVAYLRREMAAPEGGFFASQDADAEGEEGRFHVWTPSQIDTVLADEAKAFCEAYSVTDAGNFENGTSQLFDPTRRPRSEFAKEREKLLAARQLRVPPATDPKRVAAWNGYVISGLARAGTQLRDPSMLETATRTAEFVLQEMVGDDGRLRRVYDRGRAAIPAFLDDHAALVDALLDLHRAGADDRYLAEAVEIAESIVTLFFDEGEGDLFLTPNDGERLAHRPRSDHDGATPQASGLATLSLLRAGELSGRTALREAALQVIRANAYAMERAPHAFPTLLRAVALETRGMGIALVVGAPDDARTDGLAERARRRMAPEDAVIVLAPGADLPEGLAVHWVEGRTAPAEAPRAYVCRGRTCSLPVEDPHDLDAIFEEFSR